MCKFGQWPVTTVSLRTRYGFVSFLVQCVFISCVSFYFFIESEFEECLLKDFVSFWTVTQYSLLSVL